MKREVHCYATNQLGVNLTVNNTNVWNGECDKGGTCPQTIDDDANQQQIFYYHKTTGGMVGDSGVVSYNLPDGSIMDLYLNCPYTQDGNDGPSNCWFYAGISNVPAGGTSYYILLTVSIDGHPMSVNPPQNGDVVEAYITICNASA